MNEKALKCLISANGFVKGFNGTFTSNQIGVNSSLGDFWFVANSKAFFLFVLVDKNQLI
jgi:hypothetical protein